MDYLITTKDCEKDEVGRPCRKYHVGRGVEFKVWTGSKFEKKSGPVISVRLFKSIPPCKDPDATYVRVEGGKLDGYKGLFICMR